VSDRLPFPRAAIPDDVAQAGEGEMIRQREQLFLRRSLEPPVTGGNGLSRFRDYFPY